MKNPVIKYMILIKVKGKLITNFLNIYLNFF